MAHLESRLVGSKPVWFTSEGMAVDQDLGSKCYAMARSLPDIIVQNQRTLFVGFNLLLSSRGKCLQSHPSVSWRFLKGSKSFSNTEHSRRESGRVWKLYFLKRHTRTSETSWKDQKKKKLLANIRGEREMQNPCVTCPLHRHLHHHLQPEPPPISSPLTLSGFHIPTKPHTEQAIAADNNGNN